jgi:hypothetical protein
MIRTALLCSLLLLGCGGSTATPDTGPKSPSGVTGRVTVTEPTPEPVTLEYATPSLHDEGLTYADLAADFDRFAEVALRHAADPETTVELFFVALIVLGEDRDRGYDYLTQVLDPREWNVSDKRAVGRTIARSSKDLFVMFRGKPDILAAYCGATPAGRYADGDLANCRIQFHRSYSPRTQGLVDDRAAYFVDIGKGAPRPRPMKLKREDGRWFVSSYSGLLTGVIKPADE